MPDTVFTPAKLIKKLTDLPPPPGKPKWIGIDPCAGTDWTAFTLIAPLKDTDHD
ncbi:hypothetical protein ABEB22_18435 (plasmid) [Thioclava sp. 'Guangxiensis']|uniref:hypothetical protein n=1 Tax=Thioclava sp. 'Guangxiensis' TaxID=3149044 RepID=UPI0032C40550